MISPTSLIGWTGIICSASADTKVSFSSVSVPLTASKLFLHFYLRTERRARAMTTRCGWNQTFGGEKTSLPVTRAPSPAPPTVCWKWLRYYCTCVSNFLEFRLNTNIPKLWWLHWAVAVRVPNPRCSVLWSSHTTRQRTRGGVGSRNKAV